MGAQISLSTSRHLPPGFHVPPNAEAALVANGWQPPPNQEPTGSFLLPKGGPMKLTRHQADLVLRHYTAEYAERTDKASGFRTLAELGTFVRELQWRIDANLDGGSVNHLVDLWSEWLNAHTQHQVDYWEGEINVTVNEILDAAGFRGPHILRYTTQETRA